jgi:hypothetical protein
VFYRRQTSRETILETLALLAEGVRISSIARVKGIGSCANRWVRAKCVRQFAMPWLTPGAGAPSEARLGVRSTLLCQVSR